MKLSTLAALAALTLLACSGDSDSPEEPADREDGSGHGAHGGHVVDVGDHVGHVELVHDEASGTLTIHVLGPDAVAALPVPKAPQIKLATASGPVVLDTRPKDGAAVQSAVFTVTDDALKAHALNGRVAIEVGGTAYNPRFELHRH